MKLLFLDTETTGNEIGKDRLCQLCYKTDTILKCDYFKPPLPISVKAMSVTHITNKMVDDKPQFIGSEIYHDLQILLKDHILVAHNAVFDKAMLEAEGLTVPRFICTLRVARSLDIKNVIPEYNLQYLRYYLELDIDGKPHNAETDVTVLEAIFQRLFLKMRESCSNDDEVLTKMIEISKVPTIFTYFSFGKYKDKKISDVLEIDRGYLEWLLNAKSEDPSNNEDLVYTLQHYLKKQ